MWSRRCAHSRRPRCRWPRLKKTAKHLGVSFNDVVLAMAAGGLRELLLRYDGCADRPIIATVPVSTDKSTERITGNEISGMTVSLPVHIDDPLERVDLTSLATNRAKEDHDLLGPELQGRMMEYLPPPLAPAMFRRQSKRAAHNRLMNVAVSNVPGPRERGHIGGAPVGEIYSVGVLSAGSAFNMTVWSYVDQVDNAVLSDDHTFKDPHEATDAMIDAFGEIRRACGLTERRTSTPRWRPRPRATSPAPGIAVRAPIHRAPLALRCGRGGRPRRRRDRPRTAPRCRSAPAHG